MLKSYLLCACDRFGSVDGYGLNLCIFQKKGPDPVGEGGIAFQVFCLGMYFLHVFKLWPAKRFAQASLCSTN